MIVAFTIVVLGGMGSIAGALVGGLIIGVVESFSGLLLGDSLGQIGIFLIFILANIFMVPAGWAAIKSARVLMRVPRNVLMPTILMFLGMKLSCTL